MEDLRRINLLKHLSKIVAASIIMGLILIIMSRIKLHSPLGRTALFLLVGALSYGAICFVLKIEEVGKIWKLSRQFVMKGVGVS